MPSPASPHLAHPRLARFDPLERILYFDDFDEGTHGSTRTSATTRAASTRC